MISALYFRVLCETVKDFVAKVGESSDMEDKCCVLNEKLDALLKTLKEEAEQLEVLY